MSDSASPTPRRLKGAKDLVRQLPVVNAATLKRLLTHFWMISQLHEFNLMVGGWWLVCGCISDAVVFSLLFCLGLHSDGPTGSFLKSNYWLIDKLMIRSEKKNSILKFPDHCQLVWNLWWNADVLKSGIWRNSSENADFVLSHRTSPPRLAVFCRGKNYGGRHPGQIEKDSFVSLDCRIE